MERQIRPWHFAGEAGSTDKDYSQVRLNPRLDLGNIDDQLYFLE